MHSFCDSSCAERRAFFGLAIFSMLLGLFSTAILYGHPSSAALPPPAAPGGLTATVFSSAHIELAWTDNSNNETGFKIEIKSEDSGVFTQIATVGANVTSYSSVGLQASTEYFYRVRAHNAGVNSAYSNEANATTLPDFPAAPTDLIATTAGKTKINLEWTDNSNNETAFKIERKLSSAVTYKWIATAGANVTNYTDMGLSPNTAYSYRVLAYNAAGHLDYSNVAEATTLPGVPKAPSSLTATAVSASKINLAWADSSDNEDGFTIERKIGVAGTYKQIAGVGANVKSYSNGGLIQNTNYFFRVRAYNASGYSAYSNQANAKTPPPAPAAPGNLTAATASSNKINLAWTDSANNETGFKIERKTGAAAYVEIAKTGANVTSFADMNLAGNTKYFYRVRAYNAGGHSGFSNAASAATLPNPPTAPNSLTAAAVGQNQIKLAWTDNANDENGFKIERKTGAAGTYTQIANTDANQTSFADSSLLPNFTYFYRMRAYNAGGHSGYSNEANATTLFPPPAAPSSLTATAVSDSRIDLAWADNAGNEDGFKIERKISAAGAYTEITTVGPNVTGYSNTGLTTNMQYFYRVRAYNAGGHSAYSNEAGAIPFSNINLALNKSMTASSTDSSSTPSRAADGSLSTYWRSGLINATAPIAWLSVQLSSSSPAPIGRAVIKWYQNYFAIEYELQVSNDGTSWTTVYANNAGLAGTQDFSFTQTTAQFARLYMKKHEKSNYRVIELELYANAGVARSADNAAGAAIVPAAIALAPNYPNPFNPSTTISYALPAGMHVTLKIANIVGQEVATLANGYREAGIYHVTFDAAKLPSGIYFSVLKAGEVTQVRRMIFAK